MRGREKRLNRRRGLWIIERVLLFGKKNIPKYPFETWEKSTYSVLMCRLKAVQSSSQLHAGGMVENWERRTTHQQCLVEFWCVDLSMDSVNFLVDCRPYYHNWFVNIVVLLLWCPLMVWRRRSLPTRSTLLTIVVLNVMLAVAMFHSKRHRPLNQCWMNVANGYLHDLVCAGREEEIFRANIKLVYQPTNHQF